MAKQLMRVETVLVQYVLASSVREAVSIVNRAVDNDREIASQPVSLATVQGVALDGWSDALPYGESDDGEELPCLELVKKP